jgi:hypothetical protein
MRAFPSDEELIIRYDSFHDDPEVDAISFWKEKNHDDSIDEEEHLHRIMENFDTLQPKMETAIKSLKSRDD